MHFSCERIAGLTNENYKITADGQAYALRINGQNSAALGIDREAEARALANASAAGLGPLLVARLMPEGHLVTRWIDGLHWSAEEFRTPQRLALLTDAVRRVHALPANGAEFSPFDRVASFARKAGELGEPLPSELADCMVGIERAKERQGLDASAWKAFCHNDLVCVNYLFVQGDATGAVDSIRILDWEFSGTGDIYYDLAAIVYTHDSDGAIPEALEDLMLERYFGESRESAGFSARKQRLADMKFALTLFTCLWGFVQHAMVRTGQIPAAEGFDYREFALEMLQVEVLPLLGKVR